MIWKFHLWHFRAGINGVLLLHDCKQPNLSSMLQGCRFHDASNSYHCHPLPSIAHILPHKELVSAELITCLRLYWMTWKRHSTYTSTRFRNNGSTWRKTGCYKSTRRSTNCTNKQASWSLICETSQFVVLICFGFIRLFNRCKNSSQVNSFNDWPAKAHFHSSRTCRMLCIMYDILEILFTPTNWSMWLVLVL